MPNKTDKNVGVEGMGTKGSYNIGPKDQDLSIEHLKDRLEFNIRHAEDHLKLAKEACERLRTSGVKPDIAKSFLDLADYFDTREKGSSEVNDKDAKLKSKIKEMYQ